jgi:hypothetical protein
MASLIYSDAVDYPVEGSLFPENAPEYKELVMSERLEEAKRLVEEEMMAMREDKEEISVQEVDTLRKRVKLDFKKQ